MRPSSAHGLTTSVQGDPVLRTRRHPFLLSVVLGQPDFVEARSRGQSNCIVNVPDLI
jgi:hypothetical protein